MALLPPSFLDTVVAIGFLQADRVINWSATGFLYWYPVRDNLGLLFLLTNKHVFEEHDAAQMRMNLAKDESPHEYPLTLKDERGQQRWYSHEHGDIAAIPINASILDKDGIDYKVFRHGDFITPLRAGDLTINEGDGVFVLGFPLGMPGAMRNDTIVRQGIVARVRDWFEDRSKTIMIDANIFPGNSGGPVVLKPELAAIRGTKNSDAAHLIGMVANYIPYTDIAISQNTRTPRIIFQENSGLANVVPINVIHETIERAAKDILEKQGQS